MTQTPHSARPPDLSAEDHLRLNHQAGDWYVRRQQPGWTGADERALDAWLAVDPSHRDAWNSINRTWTDAAQLRQLFPEAYGAGRGVAPAVEQPAETEHRLPSRPSSGRWQARPRHPTFAPAVLVACMLAVLGSGYGWYRWDHTTSYALDVATAPGETRAIDLPDGSHIALNIDSTLQVRYYPRRREVVLDRGEAFFQVAADQKKPFTVDSGPSQVKVIGTAFNMRAAPPELIVQVLEGKVEVRTSRASRAGQILTMGPGTGLAVDPGTGGHRSVPAVPDTVGEWRTGQIYFRRRPLAEVAAELARYLGQPVTLDNPALAALPVSGLLALRAPQSFLEALPSLVDVRVYRQAEGWRIAKR